MSRVRVLLVADIIELCYYVASVWPDLTKFRHFGKLLTVYFLFWWICYIIWIIFIVANGQILKNNQTIWSHFAACTHIKPRTARLLWVKFDPFWSVYLLYLFPFLYLYSYRFLSLCFNILCALEFGNIYIGLCCNMVMFSFFKWTIPVSFMLIFVFFTDKLYFTVFLKKCEKIPSSLRCWDSNPQPSEDESPLLTIGPGLSPHMEMF